MRRIREKCLFCEWFDLTDIGQCNVNPVPTDKHYTGRCSSFREFLHPEVRAMSELESMQASRNLRYNIHFKRDAVNHPIHELDRYM